MHMYMHEPMRQAAWEFVGDLSWVCVPVLVLVSVSVSVSSAPEGKEPVLSINSSAPILSTELLHKPAHNTWHWRLYSLVMHAINPPRSKHED
jgi:hypothetical protein